MDDAEKALSVLCAQHTLENVLTKEIKQNLIQLHHILVLCNRLCDLFSQELHGFDQELLVTNLKLRLQLLQRL